MADNRDLFTALLDAKALQLWNESKGESTSNNRLKTVLRYAINQELTEKQREYLMLYFVDGKTMQEIAEIFSINKATVQKAICRAKENLLHILRYADPRFLEAQTPVKNKRDVTKTRIKINPCPECGAEAEFVKVFDTREKGGFVRCTKCSCEGRCYTSKKYAIKCWNRRVDNG